MKNIIIIILLSTFSCNNVKKDSSIAQSNIVKEGQTELEIYDYAGLEQFLNKTDDKVYVINFWATWCAPCIKELPFFEKLNEIYAHKNVEVILVSLDFPRQYETKLKPFIKDNKLKSKVVALNDMDSNSWIPKISEEWSGAIPATLIYNKSKRQFYEQSLNYDELETQIKLFLK
jgi:thiol-disulfide isomerase/thioredoxin